MLFEKAREIVGVCKAAGLHNPLGFLPDVSETYSCNGMILLGFILEKIYGQPLEAIYEEKLKRPLGHTRSRFNIEKDEPNAAICYRSENVDELAHPWDDENIRIMQTACGSGGQFFTLNDIRKYTHALLAKSPILYSEELFELAEQNYSRRESEVARGLGWFYADEKYYQRGKLFPLGSMGHTGYTGPRFSFTERAACMRSF